MNKILNKLLILFFIFFLITMNITVIAYENQKIINTNECDNDNFYFVHITDTHLLNKINDTQEITKKRFIRVLNEINSFKDKPAFVVITGDLVEFGGSDYFGALNYQTFINCLYEKNNYLYADPSFTIPVYTTPGNHDYIWETSLKNYHDYVDKKHESVNDRYTISYMDTTLFFMDSGPNYILEPWDWADVKGAGLYKDDINWLESQLLSCSSKNKIVLMHHPAVNYRNDKGEMTNVIARNREEFIDLCNQYDVDCVLAGHTHNSVVFDSDENIYNDFPLNCDDYSTLFVQSDDCKQGIHYRNISIQDNSIFIKNSVELKCKPKNIFLKKPIFQQIIDILKELQKDIFLYIK